MRWAISQVSLHGGSRAAPPPEEMPAKLAALLEGGWRAIEVWLAHWDPFIERHGLKAARRLLGEGSERGFRRIEPQAVEDSRWLRRAVPGLGESAAG